MVTKPRERRRRTIPVKVFDEEKSRRALEFFPAAITITEGDPEDVGQPMELMPHWEDLVKNLFGYRVKEDGRRWYQDVNVYIPRKNAKTSTMAGIALAIPIIDPVIRGQGYIIASTEDQAKIAFNMMKAYIQASPALSKRYHCGADYIEHIRTKFIIKALSSSEVGKTGFKPDFVIIDEYQERKNYNLESVIETGTVTVKSPLTIRIFTAGTQDDSENMPWVKLLAKMRRIKANPNIEPRTLVALYEAREDCDPGDEEAWIEANPGYGYCIDPGTFAALWEKSKDDNEKRRLFMQYNLNLIVPGGSDFIDLLRWEQLREVYTRDDLIGQICYGGLDVGKTDDMTAFYLLFPRWEEEDGIDENGNEIKVMVPRVKQLVWYWAVEDRIKQSEKEKTNWRPWVEQRWIEVAGKERRQDSLIAKRILEIVKPFKLQSIGFDPNYAKDITKVLDAKKITLVQVNQKATVLNDPIERVKDMVLAGDLTHDGNPVFLENLRNTKIETKNGGQIPVKNKDYARKIDGVAAGLCAHRIFIDAPPPKPPSKIRYI